MKRLLAVLLSLALVSPSAAQVKTAAPIVEAAPVVGQVGAIGASLAKPGLSPTLSAPSLTAPSLTLPTPAVQPKASASRASASALAAPAAAEAAPVKEEQGRAQPEAKAKAVPAIGPSQQLSAVQAQSVPTAEAMRRLEPPAGTPRTVAELNLSPEAGRKYFASPEDWRDEVVYSIMTDRFSRSKRGMPLGDPKSGTSRHGGDIKGVTSRMDYLKTLGVSAIVLSPVTMGIPEAYHGYAPTQLLAVDPHLGTMDDYKEMVREAHKRGIKVVLDLVANHTGPVFEYKDGSKYQGQGRKEIGEWTELLGPEDMGTEDFTRRGVIDDWNNHDQATHGDFPPNYRHWDTEREATQSKLIKVASWWLKETDVDGIRLDAIRHMDPGFVKRFSKELKEYAATLGKKNFLILGENSTGVDADIVGDLGLGTDSGYNYPEFRRQQFALHGKAPTRQLEESFSRARDALGAALGRIVRFIDNHDTYRFLRHGETDGVLKAAFAFLLFSTGIPLVYYGAEQAFRQLEGRLTPEGGDRPADPQNREDMFAEGQYKTESSQGDKFDTGAASFKLLQQLMKVRKDLPALRRGEQFVRWSDPYNAGIYAFSRIYQGQEVLVVLNTADEAREAEMFVDNGLTPAGTALSDALDAGYGVSTHPGAEGGSKVSVRVPARGVRVLVRK